MIMDIAVMHSATGLASWLDTGIRVWFVVRLLQIGINSCEPHSKSTVDLLPVNLALNPTP
jgi:hypothetical protein